MENNLIITIKKSAIYDLLHKGKSETRIKLNERMFLNGVDVTQDGEFKSVILEVEND